MVPHRGQKDGSVVNGTGVAIFHRSIFMKGVPPNHALLRTAESLNHVGDGGRRKKADSAGSK